jgi:hypothetical protein
MLVYFSPEARVPADHLLRSIKAQTDRVPKELSSEFLGRKGSAIIAANQARSHRRFNQTNMAS